MSTDISEFKGEVRPLEDHMRISRLDDSLFSKELAPHYMQLASKLATSELVPKCFRGKPQDLFLCWAMGYQVGLTPEQSMQCIAVINGKPAMWGDDMLALCMSHKDFVDIIEEPILNGAKEVTGYRCTVKRTGRSDRVNEFTLEMAKKAGLLAKGGVWVQYPERMLKLRARGFTLRDAFPDALKGIKPREEVEDYIDADCKVVDNAGLSRTELLKKDYLTKKEMQNVGMDDGHDTTEEDQVASEVPEDNGRSREVAPAGTPEDKLHIEVKGLIDSIGFDQERLDKALKYYEVDSIEALSLESAQDFLDKLLRM